MPRYPHLFLDGPSRTKDFSSPQQGGGGVDLPRRERQAHAERLKNELVVSFEKDREKRVAAVSDRAGTYLSFASDPGFDLTTKSLEAAKLGIRLMNVQESRDAGTSITRATVYVPQNASAHFLKKLTQYEKQDSNRGPEPKPMNATLVESIAEIRLAVLERGFWTDAISLLPGDSPDWVEAWLSTADLGAIERFNFLCERLEIKQGEGRLTFPERTVLLICASRGQLAQLIEHSEHIAEFRAAREVASFFLSQSNREQADWVQHLLDRLSYQSPDDVAVLVLDHGVNRGHRLLEPLLAEIDRHAVLPSWGKNDHHGHGTLMAGTAAYGDLLQVLQDKHPVRVTHCLESAKILPPPPAYNSKQLWGHYTAQGISLATIQAPHRKRVICMAVTSSTNGDRGRPSSWSGKLDELASGCDDEIRRLIIVSAGNVADEEDWKRYPESNKTAEIHDPAQAWNVLTVGAFTAKTRLADETMSGWNAMAETGALSPYSSTSLTWDRYRWPLKPEVIFEGGNLAVHPESGAVTPHDDLELLSTSKTPQFAQFAAFGQTSAAAAQAAWMAAKIQAAYPTAWPETVRALIVHSAEWTEAQTRVFLTGNTKKAFGRLVRACGYGVPDLERALYCANNSLTLIAQETIQPFTKHLERSGYVTNQMHLYQLPWPTEDLLALGELPVQMRVTLSYFIEPSPGEVGWRDRYRYASHALRFDLNAPGESEDEFIKRVNAKERENPKVGPGTKAPGDHWTLGELRDVGSIHSDIWSGRAADLASSFRLIVHPAVGWWRERHHLGRWNKVTRYSLIVSIHLPGVETDIYTPVAFKIKAAIPIPIEVPVV
ncbi:S8 family peptidase [Prosthecobacter sp.]|uniref:S8 family peptidase n=1 Tax=Prosthecobacter sp. TaxID=1965333 RepID=UPI00378332CA